MYSTHHIGYITSVVITSSASSSCLCIRRLHISEEKPMQSGLQAPLVKADIQQGLTTAV